METKGELIMRNHVKETLDNIERYIMHDPRHLDCSKKFGNCNGYVVKIEEENRTYFVNYKVDSFKEKFTLEIHTGINCSSHFLPTFRDYLSENNLERICSVCKNGDVIFYDSQYFIECPVREYVIFNMETDLMLCICSEVYNLDRVAHGLKPIEKPEPTLSIGRLLKDIMDSDGEKSPCERRSEYEIKNEKEDNDDDSTAMRLLEIQQMIENNKNDENKEE